MKQIITGVHSIIEALKNPKRRGFALYGTEESLKLIPSKIKPKNIKELTTHNLQDTAKKKIEADDFSYQRVPSNLFLECNLLEEYIIPKCYDDIQASDSFKIICLDQVTDVHNGAAILRTSSFYGVDVVVVSGKGSFGLAPTFSRIASGSTEFVKILSVNNLSKFLKRIQQLDVQCVGLSEHSTGELSDIASKKMCLVLGAEDKGLSNAVSRALEHTLALKPAGNTQSLNVSVAAGIAMERCFNCL